MIGVLDVLATFTVLSAFGSVSANVSQCYHCDSFYCDDPYDTALAAVTSCSDVYKNAKLYSSRIIASAASSGALKNIENSQIDTNNSDDIEILSAQDTNEVIMRRTHAEFFDIQRKIWELFNKGEIDENTEFVCVKAHYNSENGVKTYRGCVPKNTKTLSTACDFVNQKVVGGSSTSSVYGCNTCNSNLCNTGIRLQNSMYILVIGIILKITI